MITLRTDRIIAEYQRIKKVFPSAQLSNTFNFLLIPSIPLPKKFNLATTAMLIKLNPFADYKEPAAYVNRELRIFGKKSHHLDENLTPRELLDKGWVKECVQVKWHPNFSLIDFIILAIEFLEGLTE